MTENLKKTVSIFGSCISRDPFAFFPSNNFDIKKYIARNSLAGVFTPPLSFDPCWYSDLPSFEKRCVHHDINKDSVEELCKYPTDFLLLDMIDERFDLIEIGKTLLSDTKNIRSPKFMGYYGEKLNVIPRLSEAALDLWESGCRRFIDSVSTTYKANQIILVAGRWAPEIMKKSGERAPFKSPYSDLIEPHNIRLDRMFSVVVDALPGVRVFRPSPEAEFADAEHLWSKEPFHYVPSFYQEFIDWMTVISE